MGALVRSYTEFIVHHAAIAEETGCRAVLCRLRDGPVGPQGDEWRALIAQVRSVYSGAVTYNCDKYQEDHVTWWDAVDVISASGYYPVGHWEDQLDRIEEVVPRRASRSCSSRPAVRAARAPNPPQ